MNNKDLIIIALIVALIYLYYQNQRLRKLPTQRIFVAPASSTSQTLFEIQDERSLSAFDKDDEEDKESLITERDQAIRDKNEAKAEALDLGNKLKLKQQEVTRKEQEIERVKNEKSNSQIALNKKIAEWKEKYSKQGKLLDEEQLENNKLTEKVEKLEEEIKKSKENMPGSWDEKEWPTLTSSQKEKK